MKNSNHKSAKMSKKRILILFFENADTSPRVHAQIKALKGNYHLCIVAKEFTPSEFGLNNDQFISLGSLIPTIRFRVLRLFLKLLFFDYFTPKLLRAIWNWRHKLLVRKLNKLPFDLVITHNVNGLVVGSKLKEKKNIPFVFNAHEYYPRQFENNPKWVKNHQPKISKIIYKFISKPDHIFCVGNEILKEYQKNFNVKRISFVPNDKPFHNLKPSPIEEKIKIIYHGGCKRARNIENNIELIKKLPKDKFSLDLMLVVYDQNYYKELIELAQPCDNIRFIPPVKVQDIIPFCNSYDIGLFHVEPVNFNLEHCLPNKLFEYIQSRLCVITSPNISMRKLITHYKVGYTPADYSISSMIELIKNLTHEEILQAKTSSHQHAKALSSDQTFENIRETVSKLI